MNAIIVVVVDVVAGVVVWSYVHLLQQPHGCEPRARVGGPHQCGSFFGGGRIDFVCTSSSMIVIITTMTMMVVVVVT